MEPYFRIGEISSIFNIPLQTLRYYDKIGLFSPACINQETGYRYYSLYQLPLLHQIKTLKNMGIPFTEIKELTSTSWTIDKMDQVYLIQLERIEQQIQELQTLQSKLEAKRQHLLSLQKQPKKQIVMKSCKQKKLFCKPVDVSTYKEQKAEYYRLFLPFSDQTEYLNVEPGLITSQSAFLGGQPKVDFLFLVDPDIVPEGFQPRYMDEGTYLTLLIEDTYTKCPLYYDFLRQYVLDHGIEVISDVYEFCYTILPNDNQHISVWELQVQIAP